LTLHHACLPCADTKPKRIKVTVSRWRSPHEDRRHREENQKLASPEEASEFFDALRAGDIKTVREIASKNPKILEWKSNYPSVLHRAAEESTVEIVEYLLSLGFDVNSNPEAERGFEVTPLCYAAARMNREKREAMVRFLVERGANANAGAGKNSTPLHGVAAHESPELIHYLMDHGADPSCEDEDDRTPLAVAIESKSTEAEAALRERGAPLTGIRISGKRRRRKKREPRVRVDLVRHAKKVREYIANRVREQNKESPDAPVKIIELGFDYSHGGFVALFFDTRPNAAPDGEWTVHIEGSELDIPQWNTAAEALGDMPVHLILPGGEKRTVPADDKEFNDEAFAALIGNMLKSVLLSARAEGVFAQLCKAVGCELAIEELEGHYAWPHYEDRGKENLA
jgi:ankyrin repeat protein